MISFCGISEVDRFTCLAPASLQPDNIKHNHSIHRHTYIPYPYHINTSSIIYIYGYCLLHIKIYIYTHSILYTYILHHINCYATFPTTPRRRKSFRKFRAPLLREEEEAHGDREAHGEHRAAQQAPREPLEVRARQQQVKAPLSGPGHEDHRLR